MSQHNNNNKVYGQICDKKIERFVLHIKGEKTN